MMPAVKNPGSGKYPEEEIETCGPDDCGELILYLYDRQDRIAARLKKKIESLDRRVRQLEERGRSR